MSRNHVQIDNDDVIKVILQYLHENGYGQTANTLVKESGISLNRVSSLERFKSDVLFGNWENVLHELAMLSVPDDVIKGIYEQIVCELIESNEIHSAKTFLRESQPMQRIRSTEPHRYNRLEDLISAAMSHVINVKEKMEMEINPLLSGDLYSKGSKEAARAYIWERLEPLVGEIHPSRLMALIQMAIRWQGQLGGLRPGVSYNIMNFAISQDASKTETPLARKMVEMGLGDTAVPVYVAVFLSDNISVVVGYGDGLIEIRDTKNLEIRNDIEFQNEGAFMLLDSGATVTAMFVDETLGKLIVGDSKGDITIFKLKSGVLEHTIAKVHNCSVTYISKSSDSMLLVTGATDGSVKIVGAKSGKVLRSLDGHSGTIYMVEFSGDSEYVVSISEDSTIKFWSSATSDLVSTVQPVLLGRPRLACDYHETKNENDNEETVPASCTKITASCKHVRDKDTIQVVLAIANYDRLLVGDIVWPRESGFHGGLVAQKYINIPQSKKIQSPLDYAVVSLIAISPSAKMIYAYDLQQGIICLDAEKEKTLVTLGTQATGGDMLADVKQVIEEVVCMAIAPKTACRSLLALHRSGKGTLYVEND